MGVVRSVFSGVSGVSQVVLVSCVRVVCSAESNRQAVTLE